MRTCFLLLFLVILARGEIRPFDIFDDDDYDFSEEDKSIIDDRVSEATQTSTTQTEQTTYLLPNTKSRKQLGRTSITVNDIKAQHMKEIARTNITLDDMNEQLIEETAGTNITLDDRREQLIKEIARTNITLDDIKEQAIKAIDQTNITSGDTREELIKKIAETNVTFDGMIERLIKEINRTNMTLDHIKEQLIKIIASTKVLSDDMKEPLIDKLATTNTTLNDMEKQFINSTKVAKILKDLLKVISMEVGKIENQSCKRQLRAVATDISSGNFNKWAVRMIDSIVKPASGLLEFNSGDYGSAHECVRISENISKTEIIEGKYCIASTALSDFDFLRGRGKFDKFSDVNITGEVDLFMRSKTLGGICMPSVCAADDLQPLVEAVVNHVFDLVENKTGLRVPAKVLLREETCYDGKRVAITTMNIVCLSFVALFIVILSLCTYYDTLRQGTIHPLMKCFSLKENWRKLFSTKIRDHALTSINGVRVGSMFLIFYGHEVLVMRLAPVKNNADVMFNAYLDSSSMGILGFLAVETFFVISGMLVVYLFFRSNYQNIPIFSMYFARYIRLVPMLCVTILMILNAPLLCHFNLPTYCSTYVVMDILEHCDSSWWRTLLFIQNYVAYDQSCIRPSWYLAVDTQLFILSPILLYGLKHWKKLSISICVVAICVVSALNGYLTYLWDLLPIMPTNHRTWELYRATHLRFFSWLIGALFGYIIAYCQKEDKRLPKIPVIILWIFTSVILTGITAWIRIWITKDITKMEASIVNATFRQFWALAVSVLIFLCSNGSGGFINKLLSYPVFIVMSRLSYGLYLMHVYVMVYYRLGRSIVDYFNDWEIVHHFFADLVVTLMLALVFTLSVEMPFASLGQLFFRIGTSKKEEAPSKFPENNTDLSKNIFGKVNPIFISTKNIAE